jgi:8-oxo-dGTP pyrophosphatase MutT (NUDIX family)
MAYAEKFKDELLECFDEDGSRAHPRYRSEVCTDGRRRWHGVSDVWLVNRDGMFLCTQRSPAVSRNANKWQTFAGGHVKAGLTFIEAAIKELYEELGVKIKPEELFLIEKGRYEPSMHVYEKFAYLFDGGLKDLKFLDGETIDAKWYNYDVYVKSRDKNPDKWCNGLTDDRYLKIQQWLKTQK